MNHIVTLKFDKLGQFSRECISLCEEKFFGNDAWRFVCIYMCKGMSTLEKSNIFSDCATIN